MANIGTPTYTAGKFGNALTLNGTDQALAITDSAAFHLGEGGKEFTIKTEFKTSTTGAAKAIFQSWSVNPTNYAGILLRVGANNALEFIVGNNTQSTPNQTLGGTTVVTDGNNHQVVVSFRNNFIQVYLDSKLEISSSCITPVYHATLNNVRIGCQNNVGTNSVWFNGQIDDLFIAAYALDEQTITAKYAAATAQGTGDLTLTKYALVTASSYSAPNTTVTIYSGTDHTMSNSIISNAYYSTQKAPYGFPLGQEKWSVTYENNSTTLQPSPVNNVWYNLGGSLSIPIGKWDVYWGVSAATVTGASGNLSVWIGLSLGASTDPGVGNKLKFMAAPVTQVTGAAHAKRPFSTATKITRYLVSSSQYTATNLYNEENQTIRATSTLL
jgi:hypothetical protein